MRVALLSLAACTAAAPLDVAQAPLVTGLGGTVYSAGDIVTDPAELRALVIDNGIVRITYEETTPGTEATAHNVWWHDGATWQNVFPAPYGDWSSFVVPQPGLYDEAEIVESSESMTVVAWRYREMKLDVPYLGGWGITNRDQFRQANYAQGQQLPKAITVVRVTKLIGLRAGDAGYFRSWHSDPRLAPPMSLLAIGAVANNESNYGERELGLGFGAAAVWSSNPDAGVARHPEWGQRVEWAIAEAAIGYAFPHHWWAGIDDAAYGVNAHPAFAPTQGAGFPRTQIAGPWYVASVPGWTGRADVATWIAMQRPLESASWQFHSSHGGTPLVHFAHSWEGPDGRPMRWQTYTGIVAHVADPADGFACEPTAALRADVAARAAALEWPR